MWKVYIVGEKGEEDKIVGMFFDEDRANEYYRWVKEDDPGTWYGCVFVGNVK